MSERRIYGSLDETYGISDISLDSAHGLPPKTRPLDAEIAGLPIDEIPRPVVTDTLAEAARYSYPTGDAADWENIVSRSHKDVRLAKLYGQEMSLMRDREQSTADVAAINNRLDEIYRNIEDRRKELGI